MYLMQRMLPVDDRSAMQSEKAAADFQQLHGHDAA